MDYPNLFEHTAVNNTIARINNLTPTTTASWGKMSVSQMLAHCNVSYEMVYEKKHPKPGAIMKFFLKTFIKKVVTGPAPYKRNLKTAPYLLIVDERDFETEKTRMIDFLHKTLALGETYFNKKESVSFGRMTAKEWNTMFSKHLDHHLTQFGV